MLTDYFSSALTLERFRSGILYGFIEIFIERLKAKGYSPTTVRAYLSSAAHLGFWGAANGLRPEDLDDRTVAKFLDHLRACACFRRNTGKYTEVPLHVRFFLECLRDLHVVGQGVGASGMQRDSLLSDFRYWMFRNRGVTETTLNSYEYVLTDLLKTINHDVKQLEARTVRSFILTWSTRHARSTAGIAVPAVRMFLRYLIIEGKCPPGVDEAVPAIANWRLSALPRFLPACDVNRIITSCDLTTELGIRNRAMLLLLARLGLRAGDVVALRLDDIDWSQATIRLSGKGRREVRLPLTQEIGDALLAYLGKRRHQANEDHLFIRARAPLRSLSASGAVSTLVARVLKRAGVRSAVRGAHVLRHSAATEMLRQGASLQSIGAILRHRSIETTEQYAKVDISLLHIVAQPWPEVTSC